MPARTHIARRTTLALTVGAVATSIALASAPAASATDGAIFSFPQLGTVVVTGTVDDAVNFTVYRILDPHCTGTAFPGPNDSCVPQQATDTLVIPAGTYHGKHFTLADVPTCGPTQQDVYDGTYQPTVTASGNHDYLAGGILQLGTCASSSPSPSSSPSSSPSPSSTPSHSHSPTPSSTPSSSAPRSTSSAPHTTPAVSTTPPSTNVTTPAGNTSTVTSVSGGFDAASDTTTLPGVTSGQSQLASTGTDHTVAALTLGIGTVLLGAATLTIARRRPQRLH